MATKFYWKPSRFDLESTYFPSRTNFMSSVQGNKVSIMWNGYGMNCFEFKRSNETQQTEKLNYGKNVTNTIFETL